MATSDFTLKAHDTRPSIQAALTTGPVGAQVPLDLTGATGVSFIMKAALGTGSAIKAAGVIVAPATSGVVRYDWASTDTATPGDYLAEWEVAWSPTQKQTVPTTSYHTITILADLDGA